MPKAEIVVYWLRRRIVEVQILMHHSVLVSTFSSQLFRIYPDLSKLDLYQPREQAGFRTEYGTNAHLLAIKPLIEKCNEYNKPLVLIFIDFEQGFRYSRTTLYKSCSRSGKNRLRYTQLLNYMYLNATASIRLHDNTNKFKTSRGIRQGDIITPNQFTTVFEFAFKMISWKTLEVEVDGERLNHLRFADDIVLIADNIKYAKTMLKDLKEAIAKMA